MSHQVCGLAAGCFGLGGASPVQHFAGGREFVPCDRKLTDLAVVRTADVELDPLPISALAIQGADGRHVAVGTGDPPLLQNMTGDRRP